MKILTNSNNLFGNPLYWTIFLLRKCIPDLIKVGRRDSQNIHFCPLSQIKIGSFCFSVPVRSAGGGGLLVSTDCVRGDGAGPRFNASLPPSPSSFRPRFFGIVLKTLDEFPWKSSFDTLFFCWQPSVKTLVFVLVFLSDVLGVEVFLLAPTVSEAMVLVRVSMCHYRLRRLLFVHVFSALSWKHLTNFLEKPVLIPLFFVGNPQLRHYFISSCVIKWRIENVRVT